ncbi:hypothetical protein A8926_0213 [Saccharopolyspora spinosa]|uniref:Uncharacterized protein n=1 Tax=Saccharopolyspora spinosa TaxID=60894 RepID=A0A2N3XQ00_SACSN|nr:hypothetical protein A8926_0213 [Saccharopolyspora spinosa]
MSGHTKENLSPPLRMHDYAASFGRADLNRTTQLIR